jgi:hypothetical protein
MLRYRTLFVIFVSLLFSSSSLSQDLSNVNTRRPLELHGGINTRLVYYNAQGIPSRRIPFSYIVSGNVNGKLFGLVDVPISFTYSNQDFFLGQPFNQFGMSPSYKWITLHLGYRNINYSSFSLAGHQIRGAGFDLTPRKWRIGFMTGRLLRPVQTDTTLGSLRTPTYRRTGWAARIGYGDHQHSLDLVVLKAKDDSTSIQRVAGITPPPAENVVLGLTGRTQLLKSLSLYFDGAASTYVADVRIDDEGGNGSASRGLLDVNSTTTLLYAYKSGFSFRTPRFSLNSYYQHIDPNYRSMGLYFINNDLRTIHIAPSFVLMNGRLNVAPSLTLQRDNLKNTKAATTRRTLPQLTVTYAPSPRWNFGGTYTSMSVLQEQGLLPLDNSLKMDQRTSVYTAFGTFSDSDTTRAHVVTVFVNRNELADNNLATQAFSQYVGNTFNLSYSFTSLVRNFGLIASFNSNNIQTFNGRLPGNGFSLGGNKRIIKTLDFNGSVSFAFQNGTDSQSTQLGATYTVGDFGFNLNANRIRTVLADGDFAETTIFLTGSYKF